MRNHFPVNNFLIKAKYLQARRLPTEQKNSPKQKEKSCIEFLKDKSNKPGSVES